MLAAGGTAASAQEGLNFRAATIGPCEHSGGRPETFERILSDDVRLQEVSGEPARNILRLGNTRTLVSLNLGKPTATVDHFFGTADLPQ
jgi:hypothetical protein